MADELESKRLGEHREQRRPQRQHVALPCPARVNAKRPKMEAEVHYNFREHHQ